MKNNDSCEERFTKFLSVISTYYSKRRTSFTHSNDTGHVLVSENVFIQFVQQFELCICKNEWKKINQESRLMYFFYSKNNNKKALNILLRNLKKLLKPKCKIFDLRGKHMNHG